MPSSAMSRRLVYALGALAALLLLLLTRPPAAPAAPPCRDDRPAGGAAWAPPCPPIWGPRPTLTVTLTPTRRATNTPAPRAPTPTATRTPKPTATLAPTASPTPTPRLAFDQPGPYPVAEVEWEAGSVAVDDPLHPGEALDLRHFGVTFYPALSAGARQPPAATGPFPLLVWGHARFQRLDAPNMNHRQADYLLRHLASWGYVATSVNLDGLGMYSEPPAVAQRARLLLATVGYHLGAQAGDGLLAGVADATAIALAGLSRGGEGAALAASLNGGYAIRAVSLFAPTDSDTVSLGGVATQVIYGTCDGDVSDGAPVRVYERAAPPKHFLQVYGANHYNFTESLSVAPCALGRADQQTIARAALATFLAATLRGDPAAHAAIRGDLGPLPGLARYAIYPAYQDPTRLDVDTFEDSPPDLARSTLGGVNVVAGLTAEEVPLDSLSEACLPGGYQCYDCLCLVPHPTRGLHVTWQAPLSAPAAFTATLPSPVDATGFSHLAFRAASRMRPRTAPLDQPQDVRVVVQDVYGRQASVSLSALDQLIPYPDHPPILPGIPGQAQTLLAMLRGVRLPLARFSAAAPGLRLDYVTAIGLHFPAAAGELEIDDLGFTR